MSVGFYSTGPALVIVSIAGVVPGVPVCPTGGIKLGGTILPNALWPNAVYPKGGIKLGGSAFDPSMIEGGIEIGGPSVVKFQKTTALLGVFETRPKMAMQYYYKPLESDEGGGREVPTDRVRVGAEATISGVLNYLNMPLLQNIMNSGVRLGRHANGGNVDPEAVDPANYNGRDTIDTIGVIMGRERKTFDLWLLFTRNLNANMIARGCIPGYHFFSAFLHATEAMPGSGDYKQMVNFQCQRKRMAGRTTIAHVYELSSGTIVLATNVNEGDKLRIIGGTGTPAIALVTGTQVAGAGNTHVYLQVIEPGAYSELPNAGEDPQQALNLTNGATVTLYTSVYDLVAKNVPGPAELALYDHLGLANGSMNSLEIDWD